MAKEWSELWLEAQAKISELERELIEKQAEIIALETELHWALTGDLPMRTTATVPAGSADVVTVHASFKEQEVARLVRDHQKIIDAKRKSCPRCYGTGAVDAPTSADDPSCPDCDGEGYAEHP
jgi:hypothetical protein